MKRARPAEHRRRLKSGKTIIINRGRRKRFVHKRKRNFGAFMAKYDPVLEQTVWVDESGHRSFSNPEAITRRRVRKTRLHQDIELMEKFLTKDQLIKSEVTGEFVVDFRQIPLNSKFRRLYTPYKYDIPADSNKYMRISGKGTGPVTIDEINTGRAILKSNITGT